MTNYAPRAWPYGANLDTNKLVLKVDGIDRLFDVNNAQQPWSLTNPGGDDDTLRFEVRHGDIWHQGAGNDGAYAGATKERSEVSDNVKYSLGQTMYVSYDWKVETTLGQPTDQMLPDWLFCDCGQLHGWLPSTSALFMSWGGDKCRIRVGGEWADENVAKYGAQGADKAPVPRDIWYHFDWAINMASFGGRLKVTRTALEGPDKGNPHVLVDYSGAMPNGGSTQFYWKHGIYRGASQPNYPARGTLAMSYRHLYIGSKPQVVVVTPPPPPPPVVDPQVAALQAQIVQLNATLATSASDLAASKAKESALRAAIAVLSADAAEAMKL